MGVETTNEPYMDRDLSTEEHFQESRISWKIRHVCDYNIASK